MIFLITVKNYKSELTIFSDDSLLSSCSQNVWKMRDVMCERIIKTIKTGASSSIALLLRDQHPSGQMLNKFIKVNYNSFSVFCCFYFFWMNAVFCCRSELEFRMQFVCQVFCLCNLQVDWSFQGQNEATECFGFVSFWGIWISKNRGGLRGEWRWFSKWLWEFWFEKIPLSLITCCGLFENDFMH